MFGKCLSYQIKIQIECNSGFSLFWLLFGCRKKTMMCIKNSFRNDRKEQAKMEINPFHLSIDLKGKITMSIQSSSSFSLIFGHTYLIERYFALHMCVFLLLLVYDLCADALFETVFFSSNFFLFYFGCCRIQYIAEDFLLVECVFQMLLLLLLHFSCSRIMR